MAVKVDVKGIAAVAKTISHVPNFADVGFSIATTNLSDQR